MYNSDDIQYILKQSSGKIWNFYYDDKLGLCYSLLTRRNTWTEPASLQKQVFKNFFADIDREDNFHILFQDNKGNIFYSLLTEKNVKTSPILNSKSPTAYNKFLHLIPFKNEVHFFYVLHHGNSSILAHQTLNGGAVGAPKVIDYVPDSICPYSVAADKSNNIYVFYQASDGKHMQVGYKKYNSSQKHWAEFTPVTRYAGDCEFPRVITDSNDIIHICYQRRAPKQYELVYQQKIPDKNIWTNEQIIHSSSYPFENAVVICLNDAVIVYWVRNDVIYYSASDNQGAEWSKPARYNFPSGRQLMHLYYKSNSDHEKAAIRDVPGSFINGFKMAFYHEATDSHANLSPEELRNMILESLKMLRGGIEELKESDEGIKEDIARLKLAHQNLEKDMVKCSVKLNLIENEVNQLKSLASKLDDRRWATEDIKGSPETEQPNTRDLKANISSDILNSAALQELFSDIRDLKRQVDGIKSQLNAEENVGR